MIPPLLVVPPPPPPPRKPCLPCHTEYHPSHSYLPEANPDCGAGGCDGECRPCRRYWVSLAFLVGGSQTSGTSTAASNAGARRGRLLVRRHEDARARSRLAERSQAVPRDLFRHVRERPADGHDRGHQLRVEVLAYDRYRLDGLAGYRYAQLHETLFVHTPAGSRPRRARGTISRPPRSAPSAPTDTGPTCARCWARWASAATRSRSP